MGHRNAAFQAFVLTFESPWNLAGKTTELWSQVFYVSGTITHNDADAEAAALALAQPALSLANPTSHLLKIAYYPSGSLVSTVNKTYAPGQHPGTGTAYTSGNPQQAEVTIVAHGQLPDKNSRGKPVYLRKYFHAVSTSQTDPNALPPLSVPVTTLLAPYITGAGPHAVVPVSPHTGQPAATWTLETHVFTHQFRKGKKKKVAASQSLFDQLVQTIGDAAALKLLEKALTSGLPAG